MGLYWSELAIEITGICLFLLALDRPFFVLEFTNIWSSDQKFESLL